MVERREPKTVKSGVVTINILRFTVRLHLLKKLPHK